MTLKEFWEHIEKTRRKDPEAHEERLVARLAKLKPKAIIEFDHLWNTLHRRVYNWNLWGAAYLINGGCSDDGFEYFRDWLILQGRAVYEAAVKNPDSLADVVDPAEDEVEWECYPGMDAWFAATGTDREEDGYVAFHAAYDAKYPKREPLPKLGRRWDFDSDAQMRKRLPRLASLYLDRDEDE